MENTHLFSFFILILVFTCLCNFSSAKNPTIAKKGQIACTMCSSCDNPCQPVYSPPPSASNYPPPPSDGGQGVYYYSPPPQQTKYPPGGSGGAYYPPPSYQSGYGAPPPPNPIVSYFPYYYYNSSTQPDTHDYSHSDMLNKSCLISSVVVMFSSILFFL